MKDEGYESSDIVWYGECDEDGWYSPKTCEYGFLYKGEDRVPIFDTKEECQTWCDNEPQAPELEDEPEVEEKLVIKGTERNKAMLDLINQMITEERWKEIDQLGMIIMKGEISIRQSFVIMAKPRREYLNGELIDYIENTVKEYVENYRNNE